MLRECRLMQALEDEEKMTDEELAIKNVGKQDPKRHLGEEVLVGSLDFCRSPQ